MSSLDDHTRKTKLGIIGGSGLYEIDGLKNSNWIDVESPFGTPSDKFLCGVLNGLEIVFLPRHGRGHIHSPTSINFRANIDSLKRLGVTDIISLSAVGSLRQDFEPGDFVVADQFIDRTFLRNNSFFGSGCVAHVSMANPVCNRLAKKIFTSGKLLPDLKLHSKGTYIVIEGPQFSSFAESNLYRNWGCSIIGMTNMPEAKLAREAEICYATVGMVTDYDCWHSGHEAVTVDKVIKCVNENANKARSLVSLLAKEIEIERTYCGGGCDRALDNALMTEAAEQDSEIINNLSAIIGQRK
ncbi:MAG: S-methyl-5'-thioadenosine phosphorylase [Rhodospirillaceae bacterium]|nr:S-methyl-5'-thioadenosine phosphorylase [Rhodospirillaceae bacterium]|tara:strand:+ start:20233 stop:21126 length:894 start_codon:yes stop_codon:yes gene_type:complete